MHFCTATGVSLTVGLVELGHKSHQLLVNFLELQAVANLIPDLLLEVLIERRIVNYVRVDGPQNASAEVALDEVFEALLRVVCSEDALGAEGLEWSSLVWLHIVITVLLTIHLDAVVNVLVVVYFTLIALIEKLSHACGVELGSDGVCLQQ